MNRPSPYTLSADKVRRRKGGSSADTVGRGGFFFMHHPHICTYASAITHKPALDHRQFAGDIRGAIILLAIPGSWPISLQSPKSLLFIKGGAVRRLHLYNNIYSGRFQYPFQNFSVFFVFCKQKFAKIVVFVRIF